MTVLYAWLPLLIAGALVIAVVLGLVLRRHRLDPAAAPIAHSRRLRGLPGYRRALDRAGWRVALTSAAVVLMLVVATIAASRWVYTRVEQPEKYNRDIVLCLDVSGSMVDYDAEVIDRYLEMLPGFDGERMALVLWNSSAVPVFPLTDDYAFVEEQLRELRDGMRYGSTGYRDGTLTADGASLVGDGLAACALQFGDTADGDEPRSRSIILSTDNVVNGTQTVTLPQAANFAREHDITVYGLDANEFDDAFAAEYRASMDAADGRYYRLTDPASVSDIVERITSDQTSAILGAPQLLIIDRPAPWLAGMLILLPLVVFTGRSRRS